MLYLRLHQELIPMRMRKTVYWLEKDILDLVASFFDYDLLKTVEWFQVPNPLLGNLSPSEMIRSGRVDKLHKWVRQQVEANQPPDFNS